MMRTTIAILLVTGLLAGCGGREALRPAPGEGMPVAPAMARAEPTTDELLTPTPQQRPARVDEILRRSQERQDDPFDLPPPG